MWGWDRKICPDDNIWHHEACRVMTNSEHKAWIFLSYTLTNNGLFFLPPLTYYHIFYLENKRNSALRGTYMYTSGWWPYCPNTNPPRPKNLKMSNILSSSMYGNHASEAVKRKPAMNGTNYPNMNVFLINGWLVIYICNICKKNRIALFKGVLDFYL